MKPTDQAARIATTVASIARSARSGIVRSGRGGAMPSMFAADRDADLAPGDEVVALIHDYRSSSGLDLLNPARKLRRAVDELVDLIADGLAQRRQPGPPVSVLLHGPSADEIALVAHAIGVVRQAEVVHLFASRVLPTTNGGSQPIIAPAVNRARTDHTAVLFLDQLDALVSADRRDGRGQRALYDLTGEALRSSYGRAPIVIGAFAGDDAPPRSLIGRFDELEHVALGGDDEELSEGIVRSIDGRVRRAPQHPGARVRPLQPGSATDSVA